ncbi:MAG: LytTR family transcriptional regulator [Balneolaceae bacterium]|nr:LytTR family transcriptional regulator [Balneolaceae bacterium]
MLSKPHPFIFNRWSIIIPGIVTVLVIMVLMPLDFDRFPFSERFMLAVIFGAVAAATVGLSVFALQKLAPKWVSEDQWTVRREIILIFAVIVLICVVNFVVLHFIGMNDNEMSETLAQVIGYTLVISFFPVLLMVLTEQVLHQKAKLKESERLTQALQPAVESSQKTSQIVKDDSIELAAETGIVELVVSPSQIDFIQSDGNYAEIFYCDSELNPQKILIRNRLKYFSDVLPQPPFMHCHKSYIVNLDRVKSVTGNARNFELLLADRTERIPVSRSKTAELRQRFV